MSKELTSKKLSRREFLKIGSLIPLSATIPKGGGESYSHNTVEASFPPKELPKIKWKKVILTRNAPIFLFPVDSEYNFDLWKNKDVPAEVNTVIVDGLPILAKNIRTKRNVLSDGYDRYVELPHLISGKSMPVALIETITVKDSGSESKKNYEELDDPSMETHSILSGYYPNKILNILEGLRAIDDYQQEIGGFKEGEEYSMLEILDIKGRSGYVQGKTSSGFLVKAEGTCALLTNLMKILSLADVEVIERWQHTTGLKYFTGPFSGKKLSEEKTDTAIDLKHDFRWIMPMDGFINIETELMHTGRVVEKYGNGDCEFDTFIGVTMSLVSENPGVQSENLEEKKQDYRNYRDDPDICEVRVYEEPWEFGDVFHELASLILPEERIRHFRKEIEGESFLKKVVEIRSMLNSYDGDPVSGLGDYIKEYEGGSWYENEINRLLEKSKDAVERFEASLRMLNNLTWKVDGQYNQCIGLVIFMAGLQDEISFRNIGGYPIKFAKELVPDGIRSGAYKYMIHPKHGFPIKVVESTEDVEPGDLFVKHSGLYGHIGAVIGTKRTPKGKVLLCIDANSSEEGKTRIWEVDEDNFDPKFGPYPYKCAVIPPPKN